MLSLQGWIPQQSPISSKYPKDSSKVTGLFFSLEDQRSWVLIPVDTAPTEYMCSLTRSVPGQAEKQLLPSDLFISFATMGRRSPLCRSAFCPQLVLLGKYLKEQFRGMPLSELQIQSVRQSRLIIVSLNFFNFKIWLI